MNFTEFGDQFTKPLFYTLVSTIILSAIALVRVNIVGRSSIFWYAISTAIGFLAKGGQQPIASDIPSFRDYKIVSSTICYLANYQDFAFWSILCKYYVWICSNVIY